MDISSTSTPVSTASENVQSAQASQKVSSTNNDKSFKEEIDGASQKNVKETEQKNESKNEVKTDIEGEKNSSQNAQSSDVTAKDADLAAENNAIISELQADINNNVLLTGEISIQGIDSPLTQTQVLLDANAELCSIVSDARTPVKVDYTNIQMDVKDAEFFTDLVTNTDKTLQNIVSELSQNSETKTQEIQKNVQVSSTLMNALSEAVKNNKSFRIDFDKNISVIIKVDKDGALSARFIPGDYAVEQYLKQNISTLRQRFDEQELAYNELSYTGQQKRERRNNKENGHE